MNTIQKWILKVRVLVAAGTAEASGFNEYDPEVDTERKGV